MRHLEEKWFLVGCHFLDNLWGNGTVFQAERRNRGLNNFKREEHHIQSISIILPLHGDAGHNIKKGSSDSGKILSVVLDERIAEQRFIKDDNKHNKAIQRNSSSVFIKAGEVEISDKWVILLNIRLLDQNNTS